MAFLNLKIEEMKAVEIVSEVRIVPVTGLIRFAPDKQMWVGNAYCDLFGQNVVHASSPMFSIHSAALRLQFEMEERLRHGRKV
jgi:hypothetical protein